MLISLVNNIFAQGSILFLLSFPILLHSQYLNFHHFTAEDGYVGQTDYDIQIEQDQSGFLWIPTLQGLYRYDGQEFKLFKQEPGNPNGLSTNIIRIVFEDSNGKIWVGTGNGIHIYDPETEQFEHLLHDPNDPESLCGNDIKSIGEDKDGNIWVGVYRIAACVCDKEERRFKKKFYPAGDIGFLQQKNGTIWLSGVHGLYKYVPEQDSLIYFLHPAAQNADNRQIVLYGIPSLFERPDGKILGSSKRLWKGIFDPVTNTFHDLPPALKDIPHQYSSTAILQTQNGSVWFGGDSGVVKYEPNKQAYQTYIHQPEESTSCQVGYITSMFQDRAGSVWFVASREGNLSVVHSPDNPFEALEVKVGDQIMMLDERRLLTLSINEEMEVFDTKIDKKVSFDLHPSMRDCRPNWIKKGPNNSLWWFGYSTTRSKFVLEGANLSNGQLLSSSWINPFSFDEQGNLWFNDPSYLDRNTGERISYNEKIFAVDSSEQRKKMQYNHSLVDQQGRVWLGSASNGLVRYNPETEEIKLFDPNPEDPDALVSGAVSMLYEGTNGWIYIMTANGMNVYKQEEGRFIKLPLSKGVAQTTQVAVIEDNHQNIWLGLTEGLIKISGQNLDIQKFGESDGLPIGSFGEYFVKDASGRIYFTKNQKLYRFNPDELHLDTSAYPIVLTDFYLNHELIVPGKEDAPINKNIQYVNHLKLTHNQSDFGFRFISPDFKKGDRLQYYYLLENYSKDWVNLGNDNEVHFTNIPHGTYHFKVKAQTPSGAWTPEQEGIKVTVLPAWWETWWFYFMIFAIVAGLIFMWINQLRMQVRIATRKIREDKEIIEQQAEQLLELDKSKSHFFTNISHEFRTPLTVIIGMITKAIKQPEKWNKQGAIVIDRNAKNLLDLVNQILDLRKLESGKLELNLYQADIIPHLKYIFDSFNALGGSKNINTHYESELEALVMDYDPEKILRIVSNLLSNALKFTPENGNVYLTITKEKTTQYIDAENQLIIKVKDTGIGIPPEKLERIFDQFYQLESTSKWAGHGTGIGLALCKELVELMGGEISVESEVGDGSIFTVGLPVYRRAPIKEVIEMDELTVDSAYARVEEIKHTTVVDVIDEQSDLPLVLLIDDNRDILQYLVTCLEGKYQLAIARDGQEGVDKALEMIPDIIISDVMMPKKNGYEVCDELKTNEKTSHIPIILLTAKASDHSKIEGLKKGADVYLTKPFREEELLIRLFNIIESRKKTQQYFIQNNSLSASNAKNIDVEIESEFLKRLHDLLLARLDDNDYGIPEICRDIGMSRSQLHRKIKALTGQSTSIYLRRIRLYKAKELLETTDLNISQVTYTVGVANPSYFAKIFFKEFGYTPKEVRK